MNRLIKYCFVLSILFTLCINSGAAKSILLSKCKHVKALGIGSIDSKIKDQINHVDQCQFSFIHSGDCDSPFAELEEESKEEWFKSKSGDKDDSSDLSSIYSLLSARHDELNKLMGKYSPYSTQCSGDQQSILSVFII